MKMCVFIIRISDGRIMSKYGTYDDALKIAETETKDADLTYKII